MGTAASPASYKDAICKGTNDLGSFELWNEKSGQLLGPPRKQIITTENGEECINYTREEVDTLAIPFRLALIGKFSHGYPSMIALRKAFRSLNLKGEVNIGLLNYKHVLIKLSNEEDCANIWETGIWWMEGYPMRILKWSPDFNPSVEPAVAPVWIRLNNLPIFLFNKQTLTDIAQVAGKPIKIDEATLALSRPHCARICIEMDLLLAPKEHILINFGNRSWQQKIDYERIPQYCTHCNRIGHQELNCNIKLRKTELEQKDREASEVSSTMGAQEKSFKSDLEGKEVTEQKDSKSKDEEIREGDARDQPKNFKSLNSEEINEIQEETRGSDREEGEWKQAPKKKKKKRNRKRKEERKNQEGDKLDNQCRSLNQCNVEFNPDETFVSETESEKSDYSTNDEESEETETEKGESEYPSSQEKDDQSSASDGYCSENSPFLTTRNAFYLLSKANRVPRSKLLERAPL